MRNGDLAREVRASLATVGKCEDATLVRCGVEQLRRRGKARKRTGTRHAQSCIARIRNRTT